ncbi:hypothetical protein K2173_024130 [Erythroxylum novogranatense]|uniref:AB hydrolase-1 domain-containing protein n=1 Tax=Erythroxylum novogranatense TaxID=1862640 RepID=A0AAV8UFE0_9ROSI|nr:hypothetical protein K2173_024130 [Erythroxylum novogranatense]
MNLLYDHVVVGGIAEALNAKIYGNGTQTLVLSHGYGTDQSVWHYLVPCLAFYFKVVVFDLVFAPNVNPILYDPHKYSSFSGYSTDLIDLLDELKLKNTIYIGHSMSAMIGCLAAIKRPELFQHLVLLGGSPRYLNSKGYDGGFERAQVEVLLKSMEQNFSGWIQSYAPTAISVNNTEAIAEFESTLGRMNPKTAISVAKTVYLSDMRHILPHVKVPCSIIQSRKDPVVPLFVPHYMETKIGGGANIRILETEGHFPQLTAYYLLMKALENIIVIGR